MKKIIIALLAGIFLLFSSCTVDDIEYSYSIKDALKISTWIFDENIEGNVYAQDDTMYELEQLKLNEVKLMAPIGSINESFSGFTLFFKFDGIIEIISQDKDVQLSHNNTLTPWYSGENWHSIRTFEVILRFPYEGYIGTSPAGSHRGHLSMISLPFKVGSEYYLNVNAYKFDNEESPIIRAQLKLVQLEDMTSFPDKNSSPCFSIELISYEYSDVYKIMDDMFDEDDSE